MTLTLAKLAEILEGEWHGDAATCLTGVTSLARAGSTDVAYYDNPAYHKLLTATSAGAVLLTAQHVSDCPVNAIVVNDPFLAMAKTAELLIPKRPIPLGIHQSAQVDASAVIGRNVSIGPNTCIGAGVTIADDVSIAANVVIESGVVLGKSSKIANNVSIYQGCRIGQAVVIDAGAVIGALPFNFQKMHGCWQPGPSVGGVYIDDHVHIGANTVIDRGSLGDTYLAKGVCIDNLVQIAHDVVIGANTAIAGCAAVGAHTDIGEDCIIGGASSLSSSIKLVNDVVISGMSTVSRSLLKPGIYSSGTMVGEHHRWRRNAARFRRLDDYIGRLIDLEKSKDIS